MINFSNNLTIHNQPLFNEMPVLRSYDLITEYLQSIDAVLSKALNEHPRTLVVRFDLHLPAIPDCPDYPHEFGTDVITRFIESLKAKVKADLAKKRNEGNRVHNCTVRYVWVKEIGKANQPHYHFALFLNRDTYYQLGNYKRICGNLAGIIYGAWASALGYDSDEVLSLIHFPCDTPVYSLTKSSDGSYIMLDEVFRRLSYFAKRETKHYGSRTKNFGCSRR